MKILVGLIACSALVGCVDGGSTTGDQNPDETVAPPNTGSGSGSSTGGGSAAACGASGTGRAYGLSATLLGTSLIPPTPDTNTTNPDVVLDLPLAGLVTDSLLAVSNEGAASKTAATDYAEADTNDLNLSVAGIGLTANAVVAAAQANATRTADTTSSTGSTVLGLTINGVSYGDLDQPVTIPLLGLGEVRVLETVTGPGTDITVNALHVVVTGVADVVAEHAEAHATIGHCAPH